CGRRVFDAVFRQPVVEPGDSLAYANAGRPSRGTGEAGDVRDIVTLIRGAPFRELDLRLGAVELLDEFHQLKQTRGALRPAADVEGLSAKRIDTILSDRQRCDQVVHVENVAHLTTVAVKRDG